MQKIAKNGLVIPSYESEDVVAEEMSSFYLNKISKIRQDIENTTFSHHTTKILSTKKNKAHVSNHLNFTNFEKINEQDLKSMLTTMNNKVCKLDPAPTSLIKQCFAHLSPIILHIINKSFKENKFPDLLKHALVTPVIKDNNGNIDDLKNYRPISNLPFLSKLLEKTAYCQLNNHIENNKLHSKFQSSYRRHHSCETAMFKIVSDLQKSVNESSSVALILLDSSAAFDTVDHAILLKRLEHDFHIKNNALKWIESYLTNRTFSVVVNNKESQSKLLKHGVPQGSLLGPLFYILYTREIEKIVKEHGLQLHMYADDCQIYISFKSPFHKTYENQITACLSNIKKWMDKSFLKLNSSKTNLIYISHKSNLPDTS